MAELPALFPSVGTVSMLFNSIDFAVFLPLVFP